MVYNFYQWLHSAGINGLYQIKIPDKAINTFWWFVYVIMIRDRNKKKI